MPFSRKLSFDPVLLTAATVGLCLKLSIDTSSQRENLHFDGLEGVLKVRECGKSVDFVVYGSQALGNEAPFFDLLNLDRYLLATKLIGGAHNCGSVGADLYEVKSCLSVPAGLLTSFTYVG